jgi:hypothetical protein
MFMMYMYKSHKSFSNSVGQSATYSKNITSVYIYIENGRKYNVLGTYSVYII